MEEVSRTRKTGDHIQMWGEAGGEGAPTPLLPWAPSTPATQHSRPVTSWGRGKADVLPSVSLKVDRGLDVPPD